MKDIIIKGFGPDDPLFPEYKSDGKTAKALFVDIETTGLNPEKDEVWEIAGVAFEFQFRRPTKVLESFNFLQMPTTGVTEEMTRLSGVFEKDLKGRIFDLDLLKTHFESVDIIVAHNAAFDRGFINKMGLGVNKVWFCSWKDIDWRSFGMPCSTLIHLCWHHGFWYEAHRAVADCRAAVKLLSMSPDKDDSITYFKLMVDEGSKRKTRLYAYGSEFKFKEILKDNKFKWDPEAKVWWKEFYDEETEHHVNLMSSVYKGTPTPALVPVPMTKRFLKLK